MSPFAIWLVAMTSVANPCYGQDVQGRVTDLQGKAIAEAIISVKSATETANGESTPERHFKLRATVDSLASSTAATVTCRAKGFYPSSREIEIPSGAGSDVLCHFVLERIAIPVELRSASGESLGEELFELGIPCTGWGTLGLGTARTGFVVSKDPLSDGLPGLLARSGPRSFIRPEVGEVFRSGARVCLPGGGKRTIEPGQDKTAELVMELQEPPPVWLSFVVGNFVLASTRVESRADKVTLVVDSKAVAAAMSDVSLTILDGATGDPITKARVALKELRMTMMPGGGKVDVAEDGSVLLKNQAPGVRALWIEADGYESFHPFCFLVDIPRGRPVDLGPIKIFKSVSVRGTIRDEQGEVVPDAFCWLVNRNRLHFPQPLDTEWRWLADDEGEFQGGGGIGPGQYLAFASAPYGDSLDAFAESQCASNPTLIEVSGDEDAPVELILRRGTPVTVVKGEAPWYLLPEILNDRGELVWSMELIGPDASRALRLVPGDYRLRVYDHNLDIVGDRPITVSDSELRIEI